MASISDLYTTLFAESFPWKSILGLLRRLQIRAQAESHEVFLLAGHSPWASCTYMVKIMELKKIFISCDGH
jgi:hypothetical protein